jgi:hypothetical protein
MSMNYYLPGPGPRADEGLHVGLLAGGLFRFRAHPALGLVSFDAWAARLAEPGTVLVDECGEELIIERVLGCAVRKRDEALRHPRMAEYHNAPLLAPGETHKPGSRYRDAEGHLFQDFEFC